VRHDAIPPELARILYRESLELHAKGLGASRIAARLSDAHCLRVAPGTISHWIARNRKPRLRNIFQPEPSKALSYIIGANLGDGCVLVRTGCVKLEVTDWDFAHAFNSEMAKLFSRDVPNKILTRRFETDRLPLFVVKYVSRQLTSLLTLPPRQLLQTAFVYPREFLRGFFDAEGHVDVNGTETFQFYVGAENSNRMLLRRIAESLQTVFHIRSRIRRKRKSGSLKAIRGQPFRMRKTSYSLLILRLADLQSFKEQIGFSISRKSQKLADALNIFASYRNDERPAIWRKLYSKLRGEWVRRLSPSSD